MRDILAHVTTWENEALTHVPLILEGGRPREKAHLSLAAVRRQMDETHARLVDLVRQLPDEHVRCETRARRRLRLDTYGHYPLHAEAIRQWRRKVAVLAQLC